MEFLRLVFDPKNLGVHISGLFKALTGPGKRFELFAWLLCGIVLLTLLNQGFSLATSSSSETLNEYPEQATFEVLQTSNTDFSPGKNPSEIEDSEFHRLDGRYVNLAEREFTWLKINLINHSSETVAADNSILVIKRNGVHQAAELYFQTQQTQTSGSSDWHKQIIQGSAVFHQHLVAGLPKDLISSTLYLKLSGRYLRADIAILDQQAFFKQLQNNAFSDGLFYGILALFIVYNLMLYVRLKIPSYLAYSGLLSVLALWFLSGQGWLAYLLPKIGEAQNKTVLLGSLLALAIAEFAKHYLQIKSLSQRLHQTIIVSQALLTCLLLSKLLLGSYLQGQVYQIGYSLGLLVILLIIVACLSSALLGVKNRRVAAWYYLIASGLFLLMLILMGLSAAALLNMRFSWQLLQITAVIEIVIYSAGLVAIYHQQQQKGQAMQAELTKAQAQLVKQLEISNSLKDKVLNKVIDPKLFPELAKITRFLPNVLYVQASGNYCQVVYKNSQRKQKIELECSLQNLIDSFGDEYFCRIHKSYLINPGQSFSLQRRTSADYDVNLVNELLPVGRKYLSELKGRL